MPAILSWLAATYDDAWNQDRKAKKPEYHRSAGDRIAAKIQERLATVWQR
jgi:hypothetical protein